ncbi:MAG TPA: hypothetical protein VNG35_04495 [Gemmatimonadales bacterium]|nr:hypothetical protein [Gemmatimonadales bacterium]
MARNRFVGAVLASAAKIRMAAAGENTGGKQRRPQWQKDAMGYYDSLGEIWYASQFYSRTLAKLRLLPMMLNAEGVPEVTDHPLAVALLERMQDPGGGREELQGGYGKLRFLCGEGYLFCSLVDGIEVWEMLSPFELEFDGQAYLRKRSPQQRQPEKYLDAGADDYEPTDDQTAVAWRLWKKHPAYSGMPDSPMKAVLDECEELLVLSLAVRSNARSRAAGPGIILLPDELSPLPAAGVAADENAQNDPFMRDLTESMTAPIGDEGSASAVVPMIVRGQADLLDKVRHLTLAKADIRGVQQSERRECIERIALGLDLPPEVLLGVTDANHWTAWQIDEDSWKAHVEPVADDMVSDFSSAYYRPSLQRAGVANWDQFLIGYDPAEVVRRPDKSGDAIRLFDRMELKGETLRNEAGFSEDDKPDQAEIDARVARQQAMGAGAVQPVQRNDAPAEGGVPREHGAPGAENATRVRATTSLMVDRCRQLAGSRIRTKLQKHPTYADVIRYVPNEQVACTLQVAFSGSLPTVAGTPDQLVAGGAEMFTSRLEKWGVPPQVVEQIVRACEEHARDTLLDAEPGDVPLELEKLLAIAEMGVT